MTKRVTLAGKIVSLIEHKGQLILATEYGLYQVSPDGRAVQIELREPEPRLTPESPPA